MWNSKTLGDETTVVLNVIASDKLRKYIPFIYIEEMGMFDRVSPYLFIAGQVLVFFQVEHREMQAVMLAFLVFQIWKKFKTNLAEN